MNQNAKSKLNISFLEKPLESDSRYQYQNLVDVLFVIDATGSMGWCMKDLKQTVKQIMGNFSTKQFDIKFALQLYRDHPPQDFTYVQKHFDLMNEDKIISVIDGNCEVGGGGDMPEAVFDGLVNGLKKTSWRVGADAKTLSKRFLFHGCDAPPHGKEYGGKSADKNWQQNGCPCGFKMENVKELLDINNVEYYLIKCGKEADIMNQKFKACFKEKFIGQILIEKKQQTEEIEKKEKKEGLMKKSEISDFVSKSIKTSLKYSC